MCLLRVGDDRIEEVVRFWILTEERGGRQKEKGATRQMNQK